MTSPVYVSEFHGCVYAIHHDQDSDGDYLITTPQDQDGNYDKNRDHWDEVDEMALLGEEACHQEHVNFVWDALKQMEGA